MEQTIYREIPLSRQVLQLAVLLGAFLVAAAGSVRS